MSTDESNVSPTLELSTPSKISTSKTCRLSRRALSNAQIASNDTGDSSSNTTPNASRLSWKSLQSTRASSLEADDLFKAVRDETKRECVEESAAEKKQMEQQHEKKFAAEREAHKVELAKEQSELEATKNAEQKNALIAQKQILEGRHVKETAAETKKHEAQLAAKEKQCKVRTAAKDKQHEAELAAVRESAQQQANQHMIPKHKVEAMTEYVKTFPQGFETIQTDGLKLLCGLDAVVKTMEAMHPSRPRPTVVQLQALLDSDAWKSQTEDFSVKVYDPEKFSAYEIDMSNQNDFRVDQLGSLLTLWGHTDGRNLNMRIGCFVHGQGPELLFHANEDPAIVVWIHNDAVNLEFPNMIKGHYKGMKPMDHEGRAAAEKETATLNEDLLKQQSKDQETIMQLREQNDHLAVENGKAGAKVAGLETANASLERKVEQLTDNIVGLETGKADLESHVEKLAVDVTKSETDKAGLGKKVQQLQEGALSRENTKVKGLYKASVTTTVQQARTIAELLGRTDCQCGGLRSAEVKGPHSTPGQPAKKAVKKSGKTKPFIFGGLAAIPEATTNATRSGELAAKPINQAKPINKAKKPGKEAKKSDFSFDTLSSDTADYVERTNIFDIGDSAVKAGDKARASNTDGSGKKLAHETKKPSPFTFGASTMQTGKKSDNSGFRFTIPNVKPAGPSERTIPYRFKKSAEQAGEKSSLFSFDVSAEEPAEEATAPKYVDSEQPVKKSRGMPKGSGPASNAPDMEAADVAEGLDLLGLSKFVNKTGENEEKALDGSKLTDPLAGKSTKPTVSNADLIP